jgi:hypothetical protein
MMTAIVSENVIVKFGATFSATGTVTDNTAEFGSGPAFPDHPDHPDLRDFADVFVVWADTRSLQPHEFLPASTAIIDNFVVVMIGSFSVSAILNYVAAIWRWHFTHNLLW